MVPQIFYYDGYALQAAGSGRALHSLSQTRDPHFTGREEELGRLHGLLARHRCVALAGPAGVGKTALATEYAYRMAACYAAVYMLDGAAPQTLPVALGEARADWLVIVDGIVALDAMPRSPDAVASHFLYTTSSTVPAGLAALSLEPLSEAEALQLLARRSNRHKLLPGERAAAQRLARQLLYMPAALCRVADAVAATGVTWIAALRELTVSEAAAARAGQGSD